MKKETDRIVWISTAIALGLLLSCGVARADVVSPPPEDCADGSTGSTCHWGPHCVPLTCEDDSSCDGAGLTCRNVQLCIEEIDCGGGWGGHHYVDAAFGSCADGARCTRGTCQGIRVCAPGGDPGDAGPTDSGPTDSGPEDTGPGDTGPEDTGPGDTGPEDTGPGDTGPEDTGPGDTGPEDTGPEDTGPGDTGPEDTGPGDTGPEDSGPMDSGTGDDAGTSDGDGGGCDCRLAAPRSQTSSLLWGLIVVSAVLGWRWRTRRS